MDDAGVSIALLSAWSGPSGTLISNDEVAAGVAKSYVAGVELGIPFCTQIGHTGPLCESEPGRPIPYLDRVQLDFRDLVVVGGHVAFPWIDEVAVARRQVSQTSTSTRPPMR